MRIYNSILIIYYFHKLSQYLKLLFEQILSTFLFKKIKKTCKLFFSFSHNFFIQITHFRNYNFIRKAIIIVLPIIILIFIL